MIGRTLGHYRIVGRLGSGGMGVVWLAEDESLGRRVALKVLREDLADSPEKAARFEREARAIAALSHPSIVTLHAIEEAAGLRFLVMEYLEGRTLDQLVREGPLPVAEIVRIALSIAEALEAAHARGILHRDLKPSNVMVCPDGRVKVLDFGLAKLLDDPARPPDGGHETTLTREGQAVGTLHYSSPEQLRQEPVDARTDIYSFGAVLYEMATGEVPFPGDSAAEVITAVLCDPPRRIEEIDGSPPEELGELIAACLEKGRKERPGSAISLELRLRSLEGKTTSAGNGTRSHTRVRPGWRLPRIPASAWRPGLVALGGLLALCAISTFRMHHEAPPNRLPATGGRSIPTPTEIPSIVILPARGVGVEPDYLLDGVTDGVISSLGRRTDLRVISRQSAMHFRDDSKTPRQIARELEVDFAADVRIQRRPEGVDARVTLIGSFPDSNQREFRVDAVDVHEVSERTADLLARELGAGEAGRNRAPGRGAIEPEAYEAFLRGRYYSFRFDRESRTKAEYQFRRAIDIDPRFAPAWIGLAEGLHLNSQTWNSPTHERAEVLAAVERALELDPSLASAHSLRSQLMLERMEWEEAERSILRAIELEPNSAEVRRRRWMFLVCRLRIEEARREILAAQRLDPLSAVVSGDVAL